MRNTVSAGPPGTGGVIFFHHERLLTSSETAARYDRQRHGSALDELESHKGTQFDPAITDALLDLIVSQELEEVAYDSALTQVIKGARLHDPEWVLSRSAARRRRLTSVMDVEVVDVATES